MYQISQEIAILLAFWNNPQALFFPMKSTVKKLPKSQIALTVEISAEEWGKYASQAIRRLAQNVTLPGFRKGHVPEEMLLAELGEAAIFKETLDIALPQSYLEAVQSEKIEPLAPPDVKVTSEEPFTYEAIITVMPEITVKPLKNVKFKKSEVAVTKKEIEMMLQEFQEQLAEQKPVERAAKEADVIVIDFQGFDTDGVPLDGTQSKGHPVAIGAKMMIPGFEEELIGLKIGDKKTFELTFPKDYHAKNFANKKVRFEVKVEEVREKVLPELNEEFVEKLTGTKKPLPALEKEIEEALTERKKNEKRREQEEELLAAVEKAVEVDLPELLITEEANYLVDNLKLQGLQQGMPWEKYLVHLKKSEADLQQDFLPQAEKQVRTRLGLQNLLAQNPIDIPTTEISAEMERLQAKLPKEQQEKRAAEFAPQGRAWREAENRLRLMKWLEQKIAEFTV